MIIYQLQFDIELQASEVSGLIEMCQIKKKLVVDQDSRFWGAH